MTVVPSVFHVGKPVTKTAHLISAERAAKNLLYKPGRKLFLATLAVAFYQVPARQAFVLSMLPVGKLIWLLVFATVFGTSGIITAFAVS